MSLRNDRTGQRGEEGTGGVAHPALIARGAVAMLALAAIAAAQGSVFHLYVDPIYGDDGEAWTYNPGDPAPGPQAGVPGQAHPGAAPVITGHLHHAPYSFQTVRMAIGWVTTRLPVVSNTRNAHLPYENPTTHVVFDEIVIHCLPGLYGPKRDPLSSADEFDPLSGLPWNGETFPLELPGRVSIQGTSALDTIFDARGYDPLVPAANNSQIFVVGEALLTGEAPEQDFAHSFIDSVAMRGCRHVFSQSGAAVLIDREAPVKVTISNCFIYGNDVGVAVWHAEYPHAPRIVSNTIAFNHIGIWNGSHVTGAGVSYVTLVDNIIDAGTPSPSSALPPYLVGIGSGAPASPGPSCLEGFVADDVVVNTKLGCPQSLDTNFNAYQAGLVNQGNVWPFGATAPRPAQPLAAAPPVQDLTALTIPRGDLYIADVFRHDPALAAQNSPTFVAQHDLRLAPMVRAAASNTTYPSPLVNRGVDLSATFPGPITMLNGQQIDRPPGNEPERDARFDAWDFDAEGFGNPRVAERVMGPGQSPPRFPVPTPCAGTIDLGADELGEVIVSGFVDSTRIFSRSSATHTAVAPNTGQNGAGVGQRDRLVFFNVHDPSQSPSLYFRPQFNVLLDRPHTVPAGMHSEWYGQLTASTNPYNQSTSTNYTTGIVDQGLPMSAEPTRYQLTQVPIVNQSNPQEVYQYPPFMRSLVCDISPHLMIDASLLQGPHRDARAVNYAEHPYFYHSGLQFPWTADVYDSNPWYNAPWFASAPGNDNNRLYVDPSKPLWCGTLHPPLTTFNDPDTFIPRESFLFRNDIAHGVYVWDFTPQQLFTYSVGSRGWGLGGSPPGETVPYLPGSDWHGIRINLELLLPEFPDWVFYGDPQNNIQTFLILQGFGADAPEIPDPNGATSSARSSAATDLRLYEGSTSYDRAVLLLRGDRPR